MNRVDARHVELRISDFVIEISFDIPILRAAKQI